MTTDFGDAVTPPSTGERPAATSPAAVTEASDGASRGNDAVGSAHTQAGAGGLGCPWVDLRGLDYYDRRRRVFAALRDLGPGEQVSLTSDRADDVLWLRYEVEARVAERYCWSLPDEGHGTVRTTARRLRRPGQPR